MCVLPWVNLHVATNGAISPCCEFGGTIARLSDTTLEQAWNGPQLLSIRRSFVDGAPLQACRKCIDREASGEISLRVQSNARFASTLSEISAASEPLAHASAFPIALDLRFSNLCNFSCRSCWHGASSRWFSDAQAIGLTAGRSALISSFGSADAAKAQIEPGLASLEFIYFAGGEPLLQEEHYALLQWLIDLRRTDIRLAYNSNMSAMALRDCSVFDLWSKFRNVEVDASVDAAGDLGALIRKGFDWNVFVANVLALRNNAPHVRLRFGVTVSVMNIMALPELFKSLESECGANAGDLFLHSLQSPAFYRTQVLPLELKTHVATMLRKAQMASGTSDTSDDGMDRLMHQIESLIEYMNAKDLSGLRPQLAEHTRRIDSQRHENGYALFPGIAS